MKEENGIDFLVDLVAAHAKAAPDRPAIIRDGRVLSYAAFDALIDRAVAALRRDGAGPGDRMAICLANSVEAIIAFLAALRAGMAVVPLPASATVPQLRAMLKDCAPSHLLIGPPACPTLTQGPELAGLTVISVEPAVSGIGWEPWLATGAARADRVRVEPDSIFNIIYSSGTTGTPKGIVHSHRMRAGLYSLASLMGIDEGAITLVSTPLYSNTTLTMVLPTLAVGGTLVLMAKFDVADFLRLSESQRVSHAMLVPVQYRRILGHPDFDTYDLSAYRMKYVTSSHFAEEEKRETLRRWPGGLIEFYGLTEGGGSTVLFAHDRPDKLHTVGRPVPGHEFRLIGGDDAEVPPGEMGEIVGRSRLFMSGYLNRPDTTAAARWISPAGEVFFRTGDLGRVDEDGFIIIGGRKKDMIISGGFNIYPSDLEAVLLGHPGVGDAAVVGVPSEAWGETPVAFVIPAASCPPAARIRDWVNARVGKMQRLHDVVIVDDLPRNALGKVLKAQLRAAFTQA